MAKIDYQQLAIYFANSAKLLRKNAAVYLESGTDEPFWTAQLANHGTGGYEFYYATKVGNMMPGCGACRNFVGYLSKRFFVCMDSDYDAIAGLPFYSARDYVVQTHTYSWENHLCYKGKIVKRFAEMYPSRVGSFDWSGFLQAFSILMFPYYLRVLFAAKRGDFSLMRRFNSCFRIDRKVSLINNGADILSIYKTNLVLLPTPEGFAEQSEAARVAALGMIPSNAYLFMKGHVLYDVVDFIGRSLVGKSFAESVLKASLLSIGFLQANEMHQDIDHILSAPKSNVP